MRQADLQATFPEQAFTKGVEGGDPKVHVAIRQQPIDPLFHLTSRLVGECQRQYFFWFSQLFLNQPGNASGYHARLPRTGAGHN